MKMLISIGKLVIWFFIIITKKILDLRIIMVTHTSTGESSSNVSITPILFRGDNP
jgi:hypothetical protein